MSRSHLIAAGTIGNVLEWYDFSIYGFFALQIGATFFPSGDRVAEALAASALGRMARMRLSSINTAVSGRTVGSTQSIRFA